MPTGTRISNPLNCERYYECRNNQRSDLACPLNHAFDMASSQCRTSNSVSCGSRRSLNNNLQQTGVSKRSKTKYDENFFICIRRFAKDNEMVED